MFIKLDGTNIIGHDYYSHDEYTTEVNDCELVNNSGEYYGVYKYKYVNNELVELTEQEIESHPLRISNKLAAVKSERNEKLTECDFVILSDSDASTECKAAYVTYRQALRDLPNTEGFDPFDFEWPVKPAYIKAV